MQNYSMMKIIPILMVALAAFISCREDEEVGNKAERVVLKGYVQKGQFIKGSSVGVYPLDERLAPSGASFLVRVEDDMGAFDVNMPGWGPYLELKAEGYCFMENTGSLSEVPVCLSALASSSQKNVNVNLLTSLTNGRIRKLVKEGRSFVQAKKEAEKGLSEALAVISRNLLEPGFENMNIAEDGEANAVLLALSCLVQEGREMGEIRHLISELSLDFADDGRFSDESLYGISGNRDKVPVMDVVVNLLEFYADNEVRDFEIPPFYSILDKKYSKGFHLLYAELASDEYDTDVPGRTKVFHAICDEDLAAESEVGWISARVEKLCSNIYRVTCIVAPNAGYGPRDGRVLIETLSGKLLHTVMIRQRGDGQRIYMKFPGVSTKSMDRTGGDEGNKVSVNGEEYRLEFDSGYNQYYVDVPVSEKGYGISTLPPMIESAADVFCARITYQEEIDEYPGQVDEVESDVDFQGDLPYYAALKALEGMNLSNPAEAEMVLACSLLTLQFENGTDPADLSFDKILVEINEDGCLSGIVTSCQYPDQQLFDPSYEIPETVFEKRSGKVIVRNVNKDNKVAFPVHPQVIERIKCTAYDASGSIVFTIDNKIHSDLQKGKRYLLSFNLEKQGCS